MRVDGAARSLPEIQLQHLFDDFCIKPVNERCAVGSFGQVKAVLTRNFILLACNENIFFGKLLNKREVQSCVLVNF